MNKVKAIIMGFGDRGQVYAEYAKKAPERFEIVGVVDPDTVRVERFAHLLADGFNTIVIGLCFICRKT